MRIYEVIFILKPDLPNEEIEPLVEQIKGVIVSGGGTVDKVDTWGKRRLAYRVQKNSEGYYVLIQYSLEGNSAALAKEVERRLRVSDPVIKFLTVRIDEDLKRMEKRKAKRASRVARKPARSAPSAPSPAKPAPSEAEAVPALPAAAADE